MVARTVDEIFREHHIQARSHRNGHFRTVCPECSAKRKHKRDKCLSVSIDGSGARWFCHHCGWAGGEFFETQRSGYGIRSNTRHQFGDFGSAARKVRYGLFSQH
jgi:transposase-like protein